jgi:hypothetical protein
MKDDKFQYVLDLPLSNLFIMNAVYEYAKRIKEDGLEDWSNNSLVSKNLWLDNAQRVIDVVEIGFAKQ